MNFCTGGRAQNSYILSKEEEEVDEWTSEKIFESIDGFEWKLGSTQLFW